MDEAGIDLRQAYIRFAALSDEEKGRLDNIADALSDYLAAEWERTGSKGGFISPNRVCALLAVELAEGWQRAEWMRD